MIRSCKIKCAASTERRVDGKSVFDVRFSVSTQDQDPAAKEHFVNQGEVMMYGLEEGGFKVGSEYAITVSTV